MNIEIERKFKITPKDLEIIRNKCKLVKKENIEDIYMDTKDYKLLLSANVCRIRNSNVEFKDRKSGNFAKEYSWKEAIEKLWEFWLKLSDLKEAFTINTDREEYKWELNWKKYVIDIDKHKYWERYEIEVEANSEEEGKLLIDEIIEDLWLEAEEHHLAQAKSLLYMKHEIPEVYKKIIKTPIEFKKMWWI